MRRHLITAISAALATAGAVTAPAVGQSQAKDSTPPEVSIAFSSTQLESRMLNQDVEFGFAADESVKIEGIELGCVCKLGAGVVLEG